LFEITQANSRLKASDEVIAWNILSGVKACDLFKSTFDVRLIQDKPLHSMIGDFSSNVARKTKSFERVSLRTPPIAVNG
jgi:hypothetical protein